MTGPPDAGPDPPPPAGAAPVSVAVVARDEEARLPRTLASVGWAAETVVVVDSRTVDATAEVARERDARVVVREWPGYARQKARALELCRKPWVLLLDADEVVSPGLVREITSVVSPARRGERDPSRTPGAGARGGGPERTSGAAPPAGPEERARGERPGTAGERPETTGGDRAGTAGPKPAGPEPVGWEIPFQTRYLGRWLGRRGWYRERHLRLVRKERASVSGGPVHERLQVDGPVGRLSRPVLHYSYRDPAHHAEKIATYARLKARGLRERGRQGSLVEAVGRACASFLQGYLLKGRFLDGMPGLMWELMGGYYELVTYAQLRQEAAGPEDPGGGAE